MGEKDLMDRVEDELNAIDQLSTPMNQEKIAAGNPIEETHETNPSQLGKINEEIIKEKEMKIRKAYFTLKKDCNQIKFKNEKKKKIRWETHKGIPKINEERKLKEKKGKIEILIMIEMKIPHKRMKS
jgi:hypothetical protein